MKTEKNMFIAFFLNLAFSVFELVGGILTGSVAIASDAVHDLGDAASIGVACLLEKKSKRPPDDRYTYGYAGFSVLGGMLTLTILVIASVAVIWNAVGRILHPVAIHYNGMILFAVVGMAVNLCAALLTHKGESINQKAVNLHLLEDVLGWAVVLAGAIVMRFTDFALLDPILSIGVAIFLLIHALGSLKEILELLMGKLPHGIALSELEAHLLEVEGVLEVHHLHLWSMDGQSLYATMHVVATGDPVTVKAQLRAELKEHGIGHATLELEAEGEPCEARVCCVEAGHHHHHHHHHHH